MTIKHENLTFFLLKLSLKTLYVKYDAFSWRNCSIIFPNKKEAVTSENVKNYILEKKLYIPFWIQWSKPNKGILFY